MTNFNKLVSMFIESDEMGHYDPSTHKICLYGIENAPAVLNDIRQRIQAVTTSFKLIVLQPEEHYTNINILDIDL